MSQKDTSKEIKPVYLKDFEACNVEHTDEVLALVLGVDGLVDLGDEPQEHPGVQGLGEGGHCELDLRHRLTLRDPLSSDLHLGHQESLQQVSAVHSEQMGHLQTHRKLN